MKVFLTGASGYVGSVVAEKLKGRGHQILGLARNAATGEKLQNTGIESVLGDLNDTEILKTAAKDSDAVIHTAFSHDFSDYNDAVDLDRNVIAAFGEILAQTNKPLIITSSSAILGDTKSYVADEDYPIDQNSPRRLRGEAEFDALKLSQRGIRSIVLRLPLFVYGRGGSSFVPFIINQARAAGEARYVESGEHKVSAVHVEDAADLYTSALETTTAKGLYNVSGESVSLKELNEAAARLLNVRTKSINAEKAEKEFGKMFNLLSINNQLSAEKAQGELGWQPKANTTITDDIENGSYRNSI